MSVFSNPASGAAAEADAYIAAVLDLLGEEDPDEVLGSTAAWLEQRLAELTPEQVRRPEGAGRWSVGEVVQHLADSELVWGYRLRKVLAEDRPALTGFDQDLWADRLDYRATPPAEALGMFKALREANLALLARAGEGDLERVGVHDERGEESVRHMMRLYAGHDLVHRRQIERIEGMVAGRGQSSSQA